VRTRLPRAALTVLVVLTAGGIHLSSDTAFASAAETTQYLSRLNAERVQHGMSPVSLRPDLTAIAQSWAEHMANTQLLAHNPNLTRTASNWEVLGENVGVGPTVDDIDAAFMSSPTHRDNILEPRYTEVGIGSVDTSDRIWITVDFRDPRTRTISAPVTPPKPPRGNPLALAALTADTPYAPGCMLRLVWL